MLLTAARRFTDLRAAVALELLGLGLLTICSLVEPPFISSSQGVVWDWPSPEYASNSDFCINDVQPNGRIICFTGPVEPNGPGPQLGETVQLTYLDLARGSEVLSVVTSRGRPDSVIYTTPANATYAARRGITYAALIGLLMGALLSSAGVALFLLAGRRVGTPTGGLSATSALVCGVGIVPLLTVEGGLPGGTAVSWVMTVLWLAAAATAIVSGVVSRSRRERPRSFSGYGLFTSLAISGLWVVSWAVYVVGHID